MSKKITITLVPRQVGQVIDELIQSIFKQLSSEQITPQGNDLTKLIPYHYYPTYDLFQGQCYQQYLGNTCGYHATFNTLCCLKLFSETYSGIDYHIQSRVSFWRFKLKIEKFLIQYKAKNKLKDQWPWKMQDILNGDFERTYNQYASVSQMTLLSLGSILISSSWPIHGNFNIKIVLALMIAKTNYKKKLIIILAIIRKNHQFLTNAGDYNSLDMLISFQSGWKKSILVFDSFNNKTLDYTHQQIIQFIQMKNKERIQYKKPQMTPFQKQAFTQCQIDIQISLKLLTDLLKGKTNLRAYEYNRMFQIFADPLQKALRESQQNFFTTLKDYKHNIRSFFSIPIERKLLSTHNQRRCQEFLTASAVLSTKNSEAHLFWSYLDRCRL